MELATIGHQPLMKLLKEDVEAAEMRNSPSSISEATEVVSIAEVVKNSRIHRRGNLGYPRVMWNLPMRTTILRGRLKP